MDEGVNMLHLLSGLQTAVTAAAVTTVLTLSTVAMAANDKTIGVVVPTLDAQFWNRDIAFLTKGAEELGVKLIVLNADNKPDQMIKSIEDLVARNVDGIISVGYWSTGAKTILAAQRKKIPVILTDSYPDFAPQSEKYPNYLAFVGPSDEDAGYRMGKALFAAIKPGADGKKVIGVVNGTAGTSVAIDRRKGLARAIGEEGNIKVAGEVDGNFVRDASQTAFESLYQGNPDITGVWCGNDAEAMGVIAALKSKGKVPGKDVMVSAMDLNPENVDRVKAGEQLFSIGGHWVQGGIGLVIMYDYLNGVKLPAADATVKLKLLPMAQNQVDQYVKDYPGGQPAYDFKAHSKFLNKDAPPVALELKYSN
ncbi:ABC transporter substrate-binding protein [Bradyrhizobium sp. C-145]|uniref:ABC transporter substrate-binding protein n=1 Tax=Bradyrhizobium sp. C-145 TaxID=574727 RepID=UPI00201B75D5|nr:ABC transporter substrate-binding protein [Bradyrhizobium sp. C-145]UQR63054.1 ABC transporter substrate-binding protein [Bradyrhizobium sp. C-145]